MPRVRMHAPGGIGRALRPYGLGSSGFAVLDLLAAGTPRDGERCRVRNLAVQVHLGRSALSPLIPWLERGGPVERGPCAEDRGGVHVALVARGRALHADALPVQRAAPARAPEDRSGPVRRDSRQRKPVAPVSAGG